MIASGGGCSLTMERGGLKVHGLLSREGRAFMINAPALELNIYGCRNEFGMTVGEKSLFVIIMVLALNYFY